MQNLNRSLSNFKSLFTKNKYSLYIHEYQAYDILKKYKLPLVPVIFVLFVRVLEPALQRMLIPLPIV